MTSQILKRTFCVIKMESGKKYIVIIYKMDLSTWFNIKQISLSDAVGSSERAEDVLSDLCPAWIPGQKIKSIEKIKTTPKQKLQWQHISGPSLSKFKQYIEYCRLNSGEVKAATVTVQQNKHYGSMSSRQLYKKITEAMHFGGQPGRLYVYFFELTQSGMLHAHGIEINNTHANYIAQFKQLGQRNTHAESYKDISNVSSYVDYITKDPEGFTSSGKYPMFTNILLSDYKDFVVMSKREVIEKCSKRLYALARAGMFEMVDPDQWCIDKAQYEEAREIEVDPKLVLDLT